MEKYSVLMSLYKNEDPGNLRRAIDSMLEQTIKPDEIVLVEDGPLPESLINVLDEYGENLKRVKNEVNLGLGLALAKGIKYCRNELVARMDTDDISVNNRCELQLKCFEEDSELSIVGGQISEFIGDITNCVGKRVVPIKDNEIKRYLKRRCPFNHMTVMFKKNAILAAGNYQDWFLNEDYYLWIRMAIADMKFENLEESLVYVRTGNDTYRRRGGVKYFKSESELQRYMYENNVIDFKRYIVNVVERLVLQILFPNRIRGYIFRHFARKQ